jgi:hypothetical protein
MSSSENDLPKVQPDGRVRVSITLSPEEARKAKERAGSIPLATFAKAVLLGSKPQTQE